MRTSGVLLPVFSLPSPHGIGCFSKEAYEWVDFLKLAGQQYWQILPLGPTSYGDSPYQSFSTYAGNPYFIDLEELVEAGFLTRKEVEACDCGKAARDIDYGKLYENRMPLLKLAYERSLEKPDPKFTAFWTENAWWLDDYGLFMAVKDILTETAGISGQRIFAIAGIMRCGITRPTILKKSAFMYGFSICFLHSGRNLKNMPMIRD